MRSPRIRLIAPIAAVPLATFLLLWGCGSPPVTVSPTESSSPPADLAPPTVVPEPVPEPTRPAPETPVAAPRTEPARPVRVEPTVRPWEFRGADGKIIETAAYRIHTTLPDGRTVTRLPIFVESALDHYTSTITDLPRPRSPMRTNVFHERAEWLKYTKIRLPEEFDTYSKLGRGGYTTQSEAVLYYIGRRSTLAITAHEGWHQYTQATFKHQLPLWLEEGIATYMEGFALGGKGGNTPRIMPWRNQDRYYELRLAVYRDRLIPLIELLARSPQDFLREGSNGLLRYYAQSWALVHFLMEGEGGRYRAGLQEVLSDAAHGRLYGRLAASDAIPGPGRRSSVLRSRTGPAVALEYFSADFDEFEAQYEAFVRDIAARGNRRRIERGQSPVQ